MLGVGWIGQSNCVGIADWAQNPSPPSAPSLARLQFFNTDWYDSLDDAGTFRPQVFSPSGVTPVLSSYDYDPNAPNPDILATNGLFGPEIYGGIALADHLGTDILNVKLASGGLYLTAAPITLCRFKNSWNWPSSYLSWDTTAVRSATPYTSSIKESGVATSIVTLGITPFALLTDPSKNWVPKSQQDKWCVVGSSFGRIIDNTATTLTIEYFFPNLFGALPAAGAYDIEQRDSIQASWAKVFIDGYCVGAKAADPTFDLQLVGIALGETDGTDLARAQASKESMQRLIWYVRNQAVANGVTSLPAHAIGISLSLILEIPETPYAEIVNQGYRELAAADPHIRLVQVYDLPTGGLRIPGVPDPFHYDAIGQIEFGRRHGAAMIDLLSVPSTAVRASVHYPSQSRVVSPLWGSPPGRPWRWEPDASKLAGYGLQVDMPHAYADKDGDAGAASVRVLSAGYGVSSSQQGVEWGYALPRRGHAMLDVQNLQFGSPHRGTPSAGSAARSQAKGFVWPAGSMAGEGFAERVLDVAVASTIGTHRIYFAGNCGQKITRWETNGQEWMQRGYCGAMGISCQVMVEEYVGDGSTLWMRHRIGDGDSSRAQTQGRGWSKVPPADDNDIVAMEYGCDELAPYAWAGATPLPTLTVDEVKLVHDHGGASVRAEAVLWPRVVLASELTPDWLGIPGCFRVVHTLRTDGFFHPYDRISIQQRVFVNRGVFDHAVSRDAATAAWTPWTNVGNYTRTFRYKDYDEIDPSYALIKTDAGPFTQGAGAALYEKVGGLCVGIYQGLSLAERLDQAFSLTVSGEVTAANNPAYAVYDQEQHGYLLQTCTQLAGRIRPGETKRAMFLLVGDRSTVESAIHDLFARRVDTTWTD